MWSYTRFFGVVTSFSIRFGAILWISAEASQVVYRDDRGDRANPLSGFLAASMRKRLHKETSSM